MILPVVFGVVLATVQAIVGVVLKEPLSLNQFEFNAIVLSLGIWVCQTYVGKR